MTNLIVPVVAAEPVVAAHRARFDPSAAQGMPAHISVLVPFLELDAIGPPELHDLHALFAAAGEPIEFALRRVRRLPNVLYLAPEPAEPFVRLTEAVWERWPSHPPYGGEFDDIVPHLTVAIGEGPFDHVERALQARLPIVTTATDAWLVADVTPGGGPGSTASRSAHAVRDREPLSPAGSSTHSARWPGRDRGWNRHTVPEAALDPRRDAESAVVQCGRGSVTGPGA